MSSPPLRSERFTSAKVQAFLRARSPAEGADLLLAFSGGLDSTVLLHALADIVREQSRYRLRAVHVDHQLHPDSGRWAEHCRLIAADLQVQFLACKVRVERSSELGIEAAAREARYDALRQIIRPGEILLSAQHADDQLETVLLALLRGAGIKGLSAMPPWQVFGPGWFARPLLDFTRADLEAWAGTRGLTWLTDPSNDNTRLDRNYLRRHIVPGLRERWPAASRSATRSASHLAEARHLLESLATIDAAAVLVGDCLSVPRWAALEPGRRRNVLRHWLAARGADAPSTRKLTAIEHDMLFARHDRSPCMRWDDFEIRRHGDLMYCGPRQASFDAVGQIDWDPSEPLSLPAGLGWLRMQRAAGEGIRAALAAKCLQVRFRRGGEVLRPHGDPHHRKLKKLLQSAAILPWWRDRLPLIYCGTELLAVGDLWVASECAAGQGEQGLRIVWEDRPQLHAVSE